MQQSKSVAVEILHGHSKYKKQLKNGSVSFKNDLNLFQIYY